jgi:TetR/AcrR family transcriptional regulator, transcriptional repressor for nem operon
MEIICGLLDVPREDASTFRSAARNSGVPKIPPENAVVQSIMPFTSMLTFMSNIFCTSLRDTPLMAMVRQFDEETVLDKVLETFWQKGWQATSMADLAEAADVQRGSLYHAYGGKEQLFLLAFDRYATRFLTEAQTALVAPSADLALRRFFDVAIANMTAGSPARGCLTTKTAAEVDAVGEQVQERLQVLLDDLEAVITKALSGKAIRTRLSTSPAEAARVIVTFTRGLAVIERVYRERDRLQALADSFVALLLKHGT